MATVGAKESNSNTSSLEDIDSMFEENNEKDDAPILPMSEDNDKEEEYDLQKELEAKFDELFGPVDED